MIFIKNLYKTRRGCWFNLYKCPSGHFIKKRVDSVNKGVQHCSLCFQEKLEVEASEMGLKLICKINNDFAKYKDEFGNLYNVKPSDIRNHYIPNKRNTTNPHCYLYLIKISVGSNEWLKLGVTRTKTRIRVKQYGLPSNAELSCEYLYISTDAREIFRIEKLVKRASKRYLFNSSKWMKHGYTETYCVEYIENLIQHIEKEINEITEI